MQPNIIDFIKSFEGFEAYPYKDVAGFPTVGYGHLCETDGCTELPYSYPMSQAEGEELLADDVRVSSRFRHFASEICSIDCCRNSKSAWATLFRPFASMRTNMER